MRADPLESAWHKFARARKHVEAVDAALRPSFDRDANPVALDVKVEPDGRIARATVFISRLPAIRPDVGPALGDAIHNFRSALDHLAWDLVRSGSARNLTVRQKRKIYFPMADNWGEFKGRLDSWLPGVCDDYRAIVRRYQPYGRGDRARAIRWLNKLSNMDKHRELIPTVVNHSRIDCRVSSNWPTLGWEWLTTQRRALNVGAPVVRVTFAAVDGTDCEVQVDGGPAIHPSLGQGVPLGDVLFLIEGTVREVLTTFDELL
jgi:hypothetical protein